MSVPNEVNAMRIVAMLVAKRASDKDLLLQYPIVAEWLSLRTRSAQSVVTVIEDKI